MKNAIKILSLIFLTSSCISEGSPAKKPGKTVKKYVHAEKPKNTDKIQLFRATSDGVENEMTQKIQFSDLTILLETIEMGWDDMYQTDNDSIYITDKDTAYFNLWPGEWFYDKKFQIEQSGFDKIELYEKIIYNVAMNSNRSIEVPICVMSNWKTFESEWSRIQLENDELRFKSNEEKTNPGIHFTVEEFKAAVKEHCGTEWYNEIRNIQSKDKLPSELFTTKYIFKIVVRKSKTGDAIKKFIVFETPTSC